MLKRLWIVLSVPWTAFWWYLALQVGDGTLHFWFGLLPWILLAITPPITRWILAGRF